MFSGKLALIVPCYNESNRLDIEQFNSFISMNKRKVDFYFVDDGSSDNTWEIIQFNILAKNPKNVFLIKNSTNRGKGYSVRSGVLTALNRSYGMYGFIDSDLQIPLVHIDKLIKSIKYSNCLVAVSTRGIKNRLSVTKPRTFLSLFFLTIANNILKFSPDLTDTQCGCKLFHNDIVKIAFSNKFISNWLFDIEIFLRLKKYNTYIRDQIVEVKLDKFNESRDSKLKLRRNLNLIWELRYIYKYYKK